jgi:hypothetical protein
MTSSMRPINVPERMAAPGTRGGRCITPASGRSKASASPSVTAVTMLTQRICTGVIGSV